MQQLEVRPGRDEDAAGFIALISRCWADYPGCVLDVDNEAPELRALTSYYAGQGGALWVAGNVEGMIATRPARDGMWEVCRVYVHPALHGTGLANRLMDAAERHALGAGATALELWTDTRFARAHRFYQRRGYVRGGSRELGDPAFCTEWHYTRGMSVRGSR